MNSTEAMLAYEATQGRLLEAAALVSQALIDVEKIRDAQPESYSPTYRNQLDRAFNSKRPYTLKDAKRNALCSAKLLRQAWELLDPVGK